MTSRNGMLHLTYKKILVLTYYFKKPINFLQVQHTFICPLKGILYGNSNKTMFVMSASHTGKIPTYKKTIYFLKLFQCNLIISDNSCKSPLSIKHKSIRKNNTNSCIMMFKSYNLIDRKQILATN